MNNKRLRELAGLSENLHGDYSHPDDRVLDQIEVVFDQLNSLVERIQDSEKRKQAIADICRLLQK